MMPVACTAVPFEAPGGYGIAVSFTDLSIRLAAERAGREREIAEARAAELSAGEARHRAILAAALDGVVTIDQDGHVTYLNAAAERIFGYRADQVLGRELADAFLPPSAREAHRRGLTRYLATGQTRVLDQRIEVTAMRADGSEFPAELTVTRAGLPGAPAFIGYVRDITERQRAEDDLLTARQRLKVVADEQAALRRVATLVARGAPQEEVFAVVAREVASVLDLPLVSVIRFETGGIAVAVGVWGLQTPYPVGTSWRLDEHGASGRVYHTGRSARVDYAHVPGPIVATLASQVGIRSAVAVPIIVSNRTWGAMMALSTVPQPAGTEARLASFTELVSTAIANAEARQELQRLADEQAALRHVATLVAQGAEPTAVFDAVCEVTGRLVGAASVNLAQFTPDEMNLTRAGWSERGTHVPPGTRLPLDGESINALIRQSHAPARVDSYEGRSGRLAARLRELGIRSEVGAPVVVDGEVWGALIAGTDQAGPLPPGTEGRVAGFADLVATAIANADAHEELKLLADEQAALRRVATLVAGGAEPRTIFDAVLRRDRPAHRRSHRQPDSIQPRRDQRAVGGLEPARKPRPARHPPANGQTVGCCPSAADASPRPRSQLPGHARAARRADARVWHQIRGRGAGHRGRQRLGCPDRHHSQSPAAARGHRTSPRTLCRPDRNRRVERDRPCGADRLACAHGHRFRRRAAASHPRSARRRPAAARQHDHQPSARPAGLVIRARAGQGIPRPSAP